MLVIDVVVGLYIVVLGFDFVVAVCVFFVGIWFRCGLGMFCLLFGCCCFLGLDVVEGLYFVVFGLGVVVAGLDVFVVRLDVPGCGIGFCCFWLCMLLLWDLIVLTWDWGLLAGDCMVRCGIRFRCF